MDDKKAFLKDIKLFVLDMDGTIYLEDKIISGSKEFIEKAKKLGYEILFFTNNSSKTKDEYLIKLNSMGIKANENDILTSGDIMISYLNRNFSKEKVYLLAVDKVILSFEKNGIMLTNETKENPDIVVLAFDKNINYEKITLACNYIRNGAKFFCTHPDINCPMIDGFIPDVGAMAKMITASSGKEALFLGKPSKEVIEEVSILKQIKKEEICFIGDRIYTDVKAGVNNGGYGILVLSGEANIHDANKSEVKPNLIYNKVADILMDL